MLTARKYILYLCAYLGLALAVLFLSPFFGGVKLDLARAVQGIFSATPTTDGDIFLFHRLPRVILAFLVGGGLAASGAGLQVVLKNPLAEPYILGIAGAGAVGAVLAISLPGLAFSTGPVSSVGLCSLAGSLALVGVIWHLTARRPGMGMNTILLAGVTFNILCGAAILLIRYLVSPHMLMAMDRWLMGGLDVVGYKDLYTVLALLVPGLILLFKEANALNQLAFGEQMASSHGVDVGKTRRNVFLSTGLMTAGAVALAGPIGFVGLIVPHAVRRLTGADHRLVLPASFLIGGAFLALCDLVARVVVAPTEMPVGIITAMIGGPVFLRILFGKQK